MKLYHGTDKKAANDIVKNGINLSIGRSNLDFGKGMYVTDNKGLAREWAILRGFENGQDAAIISYLFDDANLNSIRYKEPNRCWGEEIYNNRVLGEESIADCISGPIADNNIKHLVNNAKSGNINKEQFISSVMNKATSFQLAIKTEEAKQKMIFLKKEVINRA